MKTFARTGLLACGAALTWACAAFGLNYTPLFASDNCFPPTRVARMRVYRFAHALEQYTEIEGRCSETRDDLTSGDWQYLSTLDLVDPWGTSIAYWCNTVGTEVISAGPDRMFGTADDITSAGDREPERPRAAARGRRTAADVFDDALARYTRERGRCPTTKADLIAGGYLSSSDLARRPKDSVAFVCSVDASGRPSAVYIPLVVTDEDRLITCGSPGR